MEEALFGALVRFEKKKEGNTFVMSRASGGAVCGLLGTMQLIVKDEEVPAATVRNSTDGYNWQGRNEDDAEAFAGAFEFLKSRLISGAIRARLLPTN